MEEQLISLETAKLSKEKGFNEYCEYSYEGSSLHKVSRLWKNSEDDTEYAVPNQSFLQKWLRETHEIYIFVVASFNSSNMKFSYYICKNGKDINSDGSDSLTYEEALEIALLECLKQIK